MFEAIIPCLVFLFFITSFNVTLQFELALAEEKRHQQIRRS